MRKTAVLLALGLLVAPLAAEAQPAGRKLPRVVVVSAGQPLAEMLGSDPIAPDYRAFVHTLRDRGWIDGQWAGVGRVAAGIARRGTTSSSPGSGSKVGGRILRRGADGALGDHGSRDTGGSDMTARNAIFAVSLLLAGCATYYGTKELADENITKKIEVGKTTKPEVHQLLGKPFRTATRQRTDDKIGPVVQEEVWTYFYYPKTGVDPVGLIPFVGLFRPLFARPQPATQPTRSLVVAFDEAGIVRSVITSPKGSPPPAPPPALAAAPPPPPLPERPLPQRTDFTFEQGIAFAVDDLFIQLQRLPAFAPAPRTRADQPGGTPPPREEPARRSVIVVDTIIDAATGEQTQATELVEQQLYERTRDKFQQFEVLAATSEHLKRAEYVVTATMTPVKDERGVYRLNMAMTELRAGLVVAQAAARVRDESVDTTPTPFYRDSPALAKDRVIEGQIRTAETPADRPADTVYLERLPTSALINEGLAAFNAGNYSEALPYFEEAAKRSDGQQLRVYNGLYMSYWNLGRPADAESAFGKIVALGLATNNLAVKFLFLPGSTDFWPDAKISGPYPLWLRQLARQLVATRTCLRVTGHTSRTGLEQLNERLSVRRADVIKQRLLTESVEPSARIESAGVGSRENLSGSGTDDQRDALDRRVEFRVVSCLGGADHSEDARRSAAATSIRLGAGVSAARPNP